MGNQAEVRAGRSRQALDAAYACPRCNTDKFPHELCDEHRCTALNLNGSPCKNSRTYLELGVCGSHVRERPEPRTAQILRQLDGDDDMQSRVIRRLMQVPGELGVMETFQAQFTINTDECLAEIMRGGGDKGAQMREAGFTALADALGLLRIALRGAAGQRRQQPSVGERVSGRRSRPTCLPCAD